MNYHQNNYSGDDEDGCGDDGGGAGNCDDENSSIKLKNKTRTGKTLTYSRTKMQDLQLTRPELKLSK